MNTNHDALREARIQDGMKMAVANGWIPKSLPLDQYLSAWALMGEFVDALSQPMPEAAAQGRIHLNDVVAWKHKKDGHVQYRNPAMTDAVWASYFNGQWYALDDLGEAIPSDKLTAASPAAPEGAKPEREIEQLIRERDQRDEIIDRLCDAVLGSERPEWSSAYGFDDAVADVEERIAQLHQPSVDKAWKRFETANAAQPQAQTTLSPDDIHSCGEFCDLPECVAAREAQAQREPEVVAWMREWEGDVSDEGAMLLTDCKEDTQDGKEWHPLITLQSHREAIAKRDAALQAERGRLDFLAQTQSHIEWSLAGDCCRVVPPNGFSHWFDTPRDAIDAAITHANQVLEGGGPHQVRKDNP